MKKFATLIAALVLCFALCISASAYTASEVLNTSNASTGTAEVAFGSRTVTAEVYPAGTTFAAGKDVPGSYFSEFQVYDTNNNYVGYYFSSPAFVLPDDGKTYELQVFDGYSFTYENVYVTSAAAAAEPEAPAEPAGKVESMEIADSDTMNGTWVAKITGVFTEREDGYNAYDVVVEPDSIIECYDYYSGEPCAYSTIYAYNWNGSEYVAAPGLFTAETGTAAEVFAACGNPDMLKFFDFYSYKELCVTLAGATTPEAPAPVESFTDVTKEDTFYDAIAYVTEKGLMSGVTETAFERKNPVSHKEIFGSLEQAGTDTAAAKAWAAEQQLEDTAAATREDVITMLWIAGGKQAADESVLANFADAASISAESKTAMAWAVETGLVKGYSNGHLGAQVQLTRGAMAAILYRATV